MPKFMKGEKVFVDIGEGMTGIGVVKSAYIKDNEYRYRIEKAKESYEDVHGSYSASHLRKFNPLYWV